MVRLPVGNPGDQRDGSFVLGFLFVLLTGRVTVSADLRTALTVGFLGAYTTYSAFSLETVRLLEDGALGLALANVGASVVFGLGAAWAGISLARTL
jgi:CrcB protein